MRVFTIPGQSTEALTPEPSSSPCSVSVMPMTPYFAAVYEMMPGAASGIRPAIDDVFTMCPSPCSTRPGRNAWTPFTTPSRSTASTQLQSVSDISAVGLFATTPALLQTT